MKKKKVKSKIKVELAFRQITLMFRYSFVNIFLFEILYKLLIIILLRPIINRIMHMALMVQGYALATNTEMKDFLLSPGGFVLGLLAAAVMLVVAFYEFSVLIVFLYYGFRQKSLKFSQGIKMGAYALPALCSPGSFLLAIYVLVIVPFLNMGLSSSILPEISIPEFITGEINKFTGLMSVVAIGGAVLIPFILAIIYRRLLLVIPSMVLEHRNFTQAVRRSLSLQKGPGNKSTPILFYSIILFVAFITVLEMIGLIGVVAPSDLITSAAIVAEAFVSVIVSPFFLAASLVGFLQLSDYPDFGELKRAKVELFIGKSYRTGKKLMGHANGFVGKINSIAVVAGLKKKLDETRSLALFLCLALTMLVSLVIIVMLSINPLDGQKKLVFGHRGGAVGVENTVDSVLNGASQYADYAEVDILLSKDGVPMVIHDSNLRRLAGINKMVYEFTAEELTGIELSQNEYTGNIPTLDQLCKETRGKIKLLIELKTHGHETANIVDEVIKIVEKNELENEAIYHTLEYKLLEELKEKRPNFKVGYIIFGEIGRISSSVFEDMPADFFCYEQSVVSANLIRKCHWAEKPVYVWTVNDQADMKNLLKLGVDGIITDFPARAKKEILNISDTLDLSSEA